MPCLVPYWDKILVEILIIPLFCAVRHKISSHCVPNGTQADD